MKGCILDSNSFDRGDISLDPLLDQLDSWKIFPSSTNDEVEEKIDECDVVITNKVRLERSTLEKTEHLKLVMLAATGTDNVDLVACQEKGIAVTNARQYSNPAVVQHTFTLILALMTNLIRYQHEVTQGKWSESAIFCLLDHPIAELEGKTLGIIGYGNLGSAVARIAEAFGMKLAICQRPNSSPKSGRLPLLELLNQSDVVSIHCPLTADTHHLIGEKELLQMKQSAILVNTARGAIVDPQALASALEAGTIAGAGIDVLDQEPPPVNHPLLNPALSNLILTPHNAWATKESRQRLVAQMADNLSLWMQGNPRNLVT